MLVIIYIGKSKGKMTIVILQAGVESHSQAGGRDKNNNKREITLT